MHVGRMRPEVGIGLPRKVGHLRGHRAGAHSMSSSAQLSSAQLSSAQARPTLRPHGPQLRRSGASDSAAPWTTAQVSSGAQSCPTLCAPRTTARQASLSITNSRRPLKLMSIESVMPSSHLILCRPLLLLPSVFPSIRVFSNESVLRIRWPEY